MNYTRILDDLIVGSCLQTPADADAIAEREGVRTVMCLQEDTDMAYFSLDVVPIQARARREEGRCIGEHAGWLLACCRAHALSTWGATLALQLPPPPPPPQERCAARGDVAHVRHRIRDFDPFSLRMELPGAVAALARSAQAQGGTAYVHCTAGLGRAPATALAYMWWFKVRTPDL